MKPKFVELNRERFANGLGVCAASAHAHSSTVRDATLRSQAQPVWNSASNLDVLETNLIFQPWDVLAAPAPEHVFPDITHRECRVFCVATIEIAQDARDGDHPAVVEQPRIDLLFPRCNMIDRALIVKRRPEQDLRGSRPHAIELN